MASPVLQFGSSRLHEPASRRGKTGERRPGIDAQPTDRGPVALDDEARATAADTCRAEWRIRGLSLSVHGGQSRPAGVSRETTADHRPVAAVLQRPMAARSRKPHAMRVSVADVRVSLHPRDTRGSSHRTQRYRT
jgi:hypothetical protein